MVRAVVLAAGASSRMGRPKPTLALSDRADTFLSRILRTFSAAGLPEIVVVTGASADLVRAAAGRVDRRVRFVHNADWERGQLSSLQAGLPAEAGTAPLPGGVEGRLVDRDVEAILVTLVDAPLVSADTCQRVLKAWRSTRAPIVRPARGALHGHPVIFDRAIFGELRRADPDVGAKAVVRAHQRDIVEVPVDDDGAFVDVDTDVEYRAVLDTLHPRPAIQPD